MKKIIENAIVVLSLVAMIWMVGSFIDITSDNSLPNPQHSNCNAFVMITK